MQEDASDEDLIALFARTGQVDAFEQVHRRNHRPLVRYLVAKVRQRQSAEDIAQEAWTKVVLALRNGSYQVRDDATFRTFLHRVADNCRIDAFRRENIRPVGNMANDNGNDVADPATVNDAGAEPTNDPAYGLHRKRLLDRFRQFLASLSPEQGETAGLYLMGYSREEIAERTGVGAETVKSRIRYLEPKLESWREQQRLELSEEL